MKKSLCLLLSLLLVVLCLVSCDKTPAVAKSTENNQTSNIANETTEKKPGGLFEKKPDFNTEVYRVPMTDIYIDVPSSPYHVIELGYVKASMIYDEHSISVTYNDESENLDLMSNHNEIMKRFAWGFDNFFHVEDIKILNEETVTINGTEMYRFEGELLCYYETIINGQINKTTYTQYIVGYTFIKDGTPCSLIGTVLNKNKVQPESVEKDVEEKVDVLIKTLRSEP